MGRAKKEMEGVGEPGEGGRIIDTFAGGRQFAANAHCLASQ